MKAKEVKKILNISQPTLSKYVKIGLIRCIKINKYHYEYLEDDVLKIIGLNKKPNKNLIVSYSRVSTQNQKEQLKMQTQRLYDYSISKGLELYKQFEDIGSAMSFVNRKNFLSLIQMIVNKEISLIIIENKDRFVRFGFEFFEYFLKMYGCSFLIINDSIQNKSYEQEMTEDLFSIIHHFSMKMYSQRRKLNKIKKELLSNDNS